MKKIWIIVSSVVLLVIIAGATYYFINLNSGGNRTAFNNSSQPVASTETANVVKNDVEKVNQVNSDSGQIKYVKGNIYEVAGHNVEYVNNDELNDFVTVDGNKILEGFNEGVVLKNFLKINYGENRWLVLEYTHEAMDLEPKDLMIFDLDSKKKITISYDNADSIGGYFEINNWQISDSLVGDKCDNNSIKNQTQAGEAKVYLKGFYLQETGTSKNSGLIYSTNSKLAVECKIDCDGGGCYGLKEGELFVHTNQSQKKFLGFSSNGDLVYFSATGKGWTAYYIYNVAQNIITETTLDNVNQNKVKLTLVKAF